MRLLVSQTGAPTFPFLKLLEPKRASCERDAGLKRSRTSLRVWFIPKWSIVMHQTCFPSEPVGREHADKWLQDVTRQAVQKGNGSVCVVLRRAHLQTRVGKSMPSTFAGRNEPQPPNYQLALIADCSLEVLVHCLGGENGKTRVRPALQWLQRGGDTGVAIGKWILSTGTSHVS